MEGKSTNSTKLKTTRGRKKVQAVRNWKPHAEEKKYRQYEIENHTRKEKSTSRTKLKTTRGRKKVQAGRNWKPHAEEKKYRQYEIENHTRKKKSTDRTKLKTTHGEKKYRQHEIESRTRKKKSIDSTKLKTTRERKTGHTKSKIIRGKKSGANKILYKSPNLKTFVKQGIAKKWIYLSHTHYQLLQ